MSGFLEQRELFWAPVVCHMLEHFNAIAFKFPTFIFIYNGAALISGDRI